MNLRHIYSRVLISFIILLSGCNDMSEYQESFKIENNKSQESLIKKMDEAGINYKVDDDGSVLFHESDGKVVMKLASDVMSVGKGEFVSFHYSDSKYTNMLEKKLKDNGVKYEIKEINKIINIRLNNNHKDKWGPIINEIDRLVIEEYREETEVK